LSGAGVYREFTTLTHPPQCFFNCRRPVGVSVPRVHAAKRGSQSRKQLIYKFWDGDDALQHLTHSFPTEMISRRSPAGGSADGTAKSRSGKLLRSTPISTPAA